MSQRALIIKIYWTAAILGLFLLAFALAVVFLNPTSVGNPDFVENTYLWATIWALNFIIILILTFALARDLIKIFFDFRARRPGSRIKSKLILTFVLFSMFPALIMSTLAFGLINSNLRLWFTSPSEQFLGSSEQIASRFYQQSREASLRSARWLAREVSPALTPSSDFVKVAADSAFQWIAVFDRDQMIRTEAGERIAVAEELREVVEEALQGRESHRHRRLLDRRQADTDLVLTAVPLSTPDGAVVGVLAGVAEIPGSVEFHAIQVAEARRKYSQLKSSVNQIETNYFSILILTTLALIFGFVWLGAYIAKRITVPLEAVAQGAEQLAGGNLDHRVDVEAADELGILVDSFNRMVGEIRQSRSQLEKANAELVSTNLELDERRRYTETILQNIATGVLSLDSAGTIRSVNEAALIMLQTTRERVLNRRISEISGEELQAEFLIMQQRAQLYGTYRKDIVIQQGERQLFVAATVSASGPPMQQQIEYLIVLDDLTELIRAEKFAAWQEVARRLAHEIKNPLTPIQLSADRIRKRFERIRQEDSPQLEDFGEVVDQAVQIISTEADLLKTLVSEFSRFARLPLSQPVATDLNSLIQQALSHYNGALAGVEIELDLDRRIRVVELDPEQMRRVFVNLIDNSLDALGEGPGQHYIRIRTRLNESRRSVTIEFEDSGAGIAPEDYENLFLPYFSTKKKGTGLGLAIVRQIVSEHNGYIRAEPNDPSGMRFTMDIPLRTTTDGADATG